MHNTYSVPDLKLDLLVTDANHTSSKLDSDCEVVHWLEALVCELEQQT